MNSSFIFIAIIWWAWLAVYWHLVWSSRTVNGVSYFKIIFPIVIFFNGAWQKNTWPKRKILLVSYFLLMLISILLQI